MLALVDGQYKFRWVDVGTEGSCSDGQIFNASQLKRRIEDGRIGFPDPAPITQGGRDVPYFILADDAFALKSWLRKGLPIIEFQGAEEWWRTLLASLCQDSG